MMLTIRLSGRRVERNKQLQAFWTDVPDGDSQRIGKGLEKLGLTIIAQTGET